ncbi:cell division protein FtsQ/DivIB [Camelimonas abortus]|uniref:Cell division protein FtsQ n=1 Tax=Camelimonas abortus TaxID=1017184 RepID=A0ABV7LEJ0_9HYPH
MAGAGAAAMAAGFAGHGPVRRRRAWFARRAAARPLADRIPPRTGTALVFCFMALVGITGYHLGGHDVAFREAYGEPRDVLARAAGFGVSRIDISGLKELRREEALKATGVTGRSSLLFLDVNEVRAALERLPMVKEASVRKLYPDALAISITERQPAALWQKNGELFVIAADGAPLGPVTDMRFARLPFVVGEGANLRAAEYAALLERAGPLRGRIRAGSLEAGASWTLTMDNGVRVRLPAGEGAAAALERLVRLEREHRLLEKDILMVDLRMPDRVVARQTVEAAAAREEMLRNRARQTKGAVTL